MRFFCLRIPHFQAWANAQITRPSERVPFAVCEHGQVTAPCPLALAAGITAGMSTGKASARLNGLSIVPRDKSIENIVWHEVQTVLYGLTPKIESIQPGLLFCEVDPAKVGQLLRRWDAGRSWVGGGYAGDRATAQLAAMQAPPGTTRIIKNDWEHVGKLPLKMLVGEIHPDTLEVLAFYGWSTLGHLRPLTRRQLEEQFDIKGVRADGIKLFQFAQGAKCPDNTRPVSDWRMPEQVTASVSFDFPATEPCEWNDGLQDILTRACAQLGARGAQTVEITAQTPIGGLSARRLIREPSNVPRTLIAPVNAALAEALRLMQPLPIVVQGLELRLGSLSVPDAQTELWEDPRTTRGKKLRGVMEMLESRLPGKMMTLRPAQSESPYQEERWAWLPALEKLGLTGRHAIAK